MRDIKLKIYVKDDLHSPDHIHILNISDGITEYESRILQEHKVVQFTGLLDRNGKEIYLDDFVKAPSGNIFKVAWYDEEMRIMLLGKETLLNFNVPLYEVIGNIYENPELLSN